MYAEPPSIRLVARILGVSQGTIKRALKLDVDPVTGRLYNVSYNCRQIRDDHPEACTCADCEDLRQLRLLRRHRPATGEDSLANRLLTREDLIRIGVRPVDPPSSNTRSSLRQATVPRDQVHTQRPAPLPRITKQAAGPTAARRSAGTAHNNAVRILPLLGPHPNPLTALPPPAAAVGCEGWCWVETRRDTGWL